MKEFLEKKGTQERFVIKVPFWSSENFCNKQLQEYSVLRRITVRNKKRWTYSWKKEEKIFKIFITTRIASF